MAPISIAFGVVLVILGVAGYLATDRASATALIPSAVGVLLLGLGALALKESRRKHAMHGAAAVGLLGFLGGAVMVVRTLLAGSFERPVAFTMSAVMAVVCLVFVGLCVNSFIQARRRRAAQP